MFYFVFPHPQLLSLSYFPSSNIVTHLWQQLHIQLVTGDVIYHSEKERFKNTMMTIKKKKKQNKRGKKEKKQTKKSNAYTSLYGLDYLSMTYKCYLVGMS